jgi:hypothetical protein
MGERHRVDRLLVVGVRAFAPHAERAGGDADHPDVRLGGVIGGRVPVGGRLTLGAGVGGGSCVGVDVRVRVGVRVPVQRPRGAAANQRQRARRGEEGDARRGHGSSRSVVRGCNWRRVGPSRAPRAASAARSVPAGDYRPLSWHLCAIGRHPSAHQRSSEPHIGARPGSTPAPPGRQPVTQVMSGSFRGFPAAQSEAVPGAKVGVRSTSLGRSTTDRGGGGGSHTFVHGMQASPQRWPCSQGFRTGAAGAGVGAGAGTGSAPSRRSASIQGKGTTRCAPPPPDLALWSANARNHR